MVWTLAATAALIATGASWWIVGANNDAGEGKPYPSHASASGSTASNPPISRAHGSPLPEGSDRREPRNTLDLLRVEDAKHVQQRLADLGFFVGAPTGIWGPRSRQALRDFKVANGLGADERWDTRVETALGNPQALKAADTFVGTWASEIAECRPAQGAGIRISPRHAEGHGAACSFASIQRETSGWRVKAVCSGNGATWNANVNLAVSRDRLTWSSERGTTVYVRCRNS